MIKEYNIITKNDLPVLNVIKKINTNNQNLSIEDLVEILNKYYKFDKLNYEQSMIGCFDSQSNLIGIFKISIGNSDTSSLYKNVIATALLLSNTWQFAAFHNHTRSNPLQPSPGDLENYTSLKKMSELLGINFIDSIIINKDGWYMIGEQEIHYYV